MAASLCSHQAGRHAGGGGQVAQLGDRIDPRSDPGGDGQGAGGDQGAADRGAGDQRERRQGRVDTFSTRPRGEQRGDGTAGGVQADRGDGAGGHLQNGREQDGAPVGVPGQAERGRGQGGQTTSDGGEVVGQGVVVALGADRVLRQSLASPARSAPWPGQAKEPSVYGSSLVLTGAAVGSSVGHILGNASPIRVDMMAKGGEFLCEPSALGASIGRRL
ncbi:hypothetical protein [Streptomyces sp. NPDC005538]|uniref:hypothetical protein n=1 Tax=Streptomyces sp. NPDC005538 TaxID=3157043 RepID=UPI0033A3E6AC